MGLSSHAALWLLIPSLPAALWIAWSDLKFMKITNRAVLYVGGVFIVFGLIALPFSVWLWQLLQMVIVLVLGVLIHSLRLVGGGDAKYAAAIAPFIAFSDIRGVLLLLPVMVLSAFVLHRVCARIPAIRRLTPDWKSWDAGKSFPMGLPLSGTLITYLSLAAFGA